MCVLKVDIIKGYYLVKWDFILLYIYIYIFGCLTDLFLESSNASQVTITIL